jgi:hypothetical protein
MTRWSVPIAGLFAAALMTQPAAAQQPSPAAQPLAIQQQAANAAALAQGQVPAAAPANTTASASGALGGDAPAAAPGAATAVANPGIVPGVSPSTAPPPEPKEDVKKPFTRSLFFTAQELADIIKATKGIVNPGNNLGSPTDKPIPQVRTITLTGVLYKSQDDWLIWLNGQKLNPKTLLQEIVDIEVFQDSSVRLKWFDIGLNGIIDITMRPHQKYDIVTGLLLPVPPE